MNEKQQQAQPHMVGAGADHKLKRSSSSSSSLSLNKTQSPIASTEDGTLFLDELKHTISGDSDNFMKSLDHKKELFINSSAKVSRNSIKSSRNSIKSPKNIHSPLASTINNSILNETLFSPNTLTMKKHLSNLNKQKQHNQNSIKIQRAKKMIRNASMQYILICYIFSAVANQHLRGQHTIATNQFGGINIFVRFLDSNNPLIVQWTCLLIGKVWCNFDEVKITAMKDQIHEKILNLLHHPIALVRASACYTLALFLGGKKRLNKENYDVMSLELDITLQICKKVMDGSHKVRLEAILAIADCVYFYSNLFIPFCNHNNHKEEVINKEAWIIWKTITKFAVDPYPTVHQAAKGLIQYIKSKALMNNQLNAMTSQKRHSLSNQKMSIKNKIVTEENKQQKKIKKQ